MPSPSPRPLTPARQKARLERIVRVARNLGFVGRVKYCHVYSRSGGAQYGQGVTAENDLLTVFAEAVERDANPDDFSLEAILSHERGHQILAWHPRISKFMQGRISAASEEVLASITGAIICESGTDHDHLLSKAMGELFDRREVPEVALRRVHELLDLLEQLL